MSSAATHGRTPVCGPLQRGVRRPGNHATLPGRRLELARVGCGEPRIIGVEAHELDLSAREIAKDVGRFRLPGSDYVDGLADLRAVLAGFTKRFGLEGAQS